MTFAIKNLTDCHQSLADRHDNGVIPTSSVILSKYTRFLNRGVAYCADKLRLTKTASLTTTSGSVALPDDFLIRDSVFVDDQEYGLVDPSDTTLHTGFVYWITGNQVDGFTLNVPDDNTFDVTYGFKPTEMVSGTDQCIIPDIEAVVAYAYSFIRKSESDPFEDAESALQECDTRLGEIQSANSINQDAIKFSWN
jgi:hypothetical protein